MSDKESQPEVTWVPQEQPPGFLIHLMELGQRKPQTVPHSASLLSCPNQFAAAFRCLHSLMRSCYQGLGNVSEPDFSYGKPTRQKYEKLAGKSFTRKYLAQHGVCSEGVIFNDLLQMLI